jgi:hypothetical protein
VIRRLLILGCVAALVAPVLAGAAENPVVAAARKAAGAKSLTTDISMVMKAPGVPQIIVRGTAQQQGDATAHLTVDFVSGGQAIPMEMTLLLEGGHAVMYIKSSLFTAQLPAGRQWLRIDLDAAGSPLGIDVSSLLGSANTVAPLEHGLQSTRRLGRAKVAGATTTHYRATLNVAKAAAAVPEYGRQVRSIERTTGIKLRKVPYDVWVDRKGRMRRITVATPTLVGTARGTATMTMTYTGFDVPVSIKAPPASLVFNAPS